MIRHARRSIRLPGYDYTQSGVYFITIGTQNRECLFGDIKNGALQLNDEGIIVEEKWKETPILRPNVVLDEFVVMPNHFHGIVVIAEPGRGVLQYAPTNEHEQPTRSNTTELRSPSQTIGAIIRGFKSATAKRINELRGTPGAKIWQRNYYEHIIRNDDELHFIREYTVNNPQLWALDSENPVGANNHSPRPLAFRL